MLWPIWRLAKKIKRETWINFSSFSTQYTSFIWCLQLFPWALANFCAILVLHRKVQHIKQVACSVSVFTFQIKCSCKRKHSRVKIISHVCFCSVWKQAKDRWMFFSHVVRTRSCNYRYSNGAHKFTILAAFKGGKYVECILNSTENLTVLVPNHFRLALS